MPLTGAWAAKLLQATRPWDTESREVASVSLLVKHWVRSPRHHQPWRRAKSVTDRILGSPQPGECLAKGFHLFCLGLAALPSCLSSIQTPGESGRMDTLQRASDEPEFRFADGSY